MAHEHDLNHPEPNERPARDDIITTQPAADSSPHRPRTPLREARRTVMQHAYSTKEAAADQLIVAAEHIRAEGFRSEDEHVIHQAQQLSRSLEHAAVYLHSHTFDQMTGDATLLVQSKPWQAVMIAFVVGIIFGRVFRRSETS